MPRPDGRLYPSEMPPKPKGVARAKRLGLNEALNVAVASVAPEIVERNKPGRPVVKATPETLAAIIKSVRNGLTVDKACILHGVSRQLLDKWKKVNASAMQLFEQAEAASEEELVAIVRKAGPDDYKAAAWLLERRHAWIAATRSEHTGKDGGPVQILAIHKELLSRIASKPDLEAMKRVS